MVLIRLLVILGLAGLAGCVETPNKAVVALPEDIPRFAHTIRARGVARSNRDIAQDFLDLTFQLENGDALPRLLKYEGPIRVAVRSPGLATYKPELTSVISRLQQEAGLDIALTAEAATAQIHIHAIPRSSISRVFPGAACFIVPGVRNWAEFRRPPGGRAQILWSNLDQLRVASIFIPSDSTPQDTRDCIHEELAQSLGPANDVYRISDTVFNDDNFHSVLTPFDMLVLRILYHPRLQSGMSQQTVAGLLPRIIDQLNPAGRGLAPAARAPTSGAWDDAIEDALDRRRQRANRVRAANRAVAIAGAMRPQDHRFGLSALTIGRITARAEPAAARRQFQTAYDQFTRQFGRNDIRAAHVALHLALFSLRDGQLANAIALTNRHIPSARKAENAVVLSGLLAIKAEALRAAGRDTEARTARLSSLAWARYAFGDQDGDIARAQQQIADFSPTQP